MFQTLDDFAKMWEYESKATQRVMNNLTDKSLHQEVAPGNWTLGEIAWHIVTSTHYIAAQTGLRFEAPAPDTPVPTSAQTIAEHYRRVSDALLQSVRTQWTNEDLKTMSDFFGKQQTNAVFLMLILNHQNHHRGQMTVLMRQAGLKVPGIYGPSKEEWGQ